jgi:DNA-binding CsgD family transcriptional regulator
VLVARRPRADGLTPREVEILRLVTSGRTNRQLAEELGVSTRTIDAHLRSIYAKLGVKSRSAATRYAVEHDLL